MALWKLICLSVLIAVTSAAFEDEITPKEVAAAPQLNMTQFFEKHKNKFQQVMKKYANSPKNQVAIVNDYTDELLEELNLFIILKGLDPTQMPDLENKFEWKVILITYKGIMYLKNGWLQGLGTMRRTGDVTVSYQYPDVIVHMPLGYDVLMFDYEYKAKFMGIGPSGGMDGKSKNCRFTLDIHINMITLMARLQKFNLNTVGKISLKFNGNALTDWMLNIFVSVTIPFIKPVLNLIVQSFVTDGLQTVISYYNAGICYVLQC